MTRGGSKPSQCAYLSDTYSMHRMNTPQPLSWLAPLLPRNLPLEPLKCRSRSSAAAHARKASPPVYGAP